MRYAGFMPNDFINGEGVCVSLWTQGCPFHCEECHNQELWNPSNGYEADTNLINKLEKAITANGITRNFSVLGGEPLARYNRLGVGLVIHMIRKKFPNIKIFLWTGYTKEELEKENDICINKILEEIDVLIDGLYEKDKRDITLPLRGSRNQRVFRKVDGKWKLS